VSPQRTNLVLTTDIPDIELYVLVGDTLDVESDGGDSGYVLVELQLVEDCYRDTLTGRSVSRSRFKAPPTCLSSRVQTQHEDTHLLRSEDLGHHL